MNTPICDFVRRYADEGNLRLHMPGHKGVPLLGVEPLDLTEIDGADSLYEADGIIRESEENASRLFGSQTFYSTEGSSQCIRAMLLLTLQYAKRHGKRPTVAAGRNAHRTFLSAVALLDLDVKWLADDTDDSYLSCTPDMNALEGLLQNENERPVAVYLTSPDYLGNVSDVRAIADLCHRYGVLLLVDNAHGAYLKFLPESQHPIDLGADLCCDSAHKTLPSLTGAAYLHLSRNVGDATVAQAKNALALFGSTSPSYLILQSLDMTNQYLSDGYAARLAAFADEVRDCCQQLTAQGYRLFGNEPLKLTLETKSYGYTGSALSAILQKSGIVCEFADPDFLVLMLTPEVGADGLQRLTQSLLEIPNRPAIGQRPPKAHLPRRVLSVRDATLSDCETLPVEQCLGRVLAAASVSCPPAVPIIVCGEQIDAQAIEAFRYYGITHCTVVRPPNKNARIQSV